MYNIYQPSLSLYSIERNHRPLADPPFHSLYRNEIEHLEIMEMGKEERMHATELAVKAQNE